MMRPDKDFYRARRIRTGTELIGGAIVLYRTPPRHEKLVRCHRVQREMYV